MNFSCVNVSCSCEHVHVRATYAQIKHSSTIGSFTYTMHCTIVLNTPNMSYMLAGMAFWAFNDYNIKVDIRWQHKSLLTIKSIIWAVMKKSQHESHVVMEICDIHTFGYNVQGIYILESPSSQETGTKDVKRV